MGCPNCGKDEAYVIDSRPTDLGRRRRYRCYACDHRFSTYEASVDDLLDYYLHDKRFAEKVRREVARDMIKQLERMGLDDVR